MRGVPRPPRRAGARRRPGGRYQPPSRTSAVRDERMSERHSMRKIREVLRLKYEQKCSQREIQAATGLSKGSVADYLRRVEAAEIDWSVAEEIAS